MSSTIKEILSNNGKLSASCFIDIEDTELLRQFKNYINNEKINTIFIPYGTREKRNLLLENIAASLEDAKKPTSLLYIKYLINIINQTELNYDLIKEELNKTIIKNYETSEFISLIFTYLNKRINHEVKLNKKEIINTIKNNNPLDFTDPNKKYIGSQGIPDNIDAFIQSVASSLLLLLKYIAHERNLNKNSIIEVPEIRKKEMFFKGDLSDLEPELERILGLAQSWSELEKISLEHLYFENNYQNKIITGPYRIDKNNKEVINATMWNIPKNDFLAYDYISNARLSIQLSEKFTSSFKSIGNPPIYQPSIFTERLTKAHLEDLLNIDINSNKKFSGFTFNEWISVYTTIIETCKKNKPRNGIYSIRLNDLIVNLKNNGFKDDKSCNKIINILSISPNSRDFFDSPLIKTNNGKIYIFKHFLDSIIITNSILSSLSSLGADVGDKGKGFEIKVNSELTSLGFKPITNFHFEIEDEKYQYDSLFIYGKYLFVIECKNFFVSFTNPTKAYRNSEIILDSVNQVKRLISGLKLNKKIVLEKTKININEFKIIPVVMSCLPYYCEPINDVFICDFRLFFRYFKSNGIYSTNIKTGEMNLEKLLWRAEKPYAEEFINYLQNPEPFNKLKYKLNIRYLVRIINNDNGFVSYYLDV
ncbi:nuclease-related domain-containing protein [Providencia huaxiensis]|uniref:nuclease-related domain-containing protein n=1 Tax=Providencia huaxiensis TaxID=2027290 RepID=UPI00375686BA